MKVEVELDVKSCPTCGIVYAGPADWFAMLWRRHSRGEKVLCYCPVGHAAAFAGEGRGRDLRAENEALKQEIEALKAAAAPKRQPNKAKGGHMRALALSAEDRSRIAREAANKRWGNANVEASDQ